MGVSYLAMVEYTTGDKRVLHKFFTDKRAKSDSPKTYAKADAWVGAQLREHGTQNVRCTLSKVLFCIIG